MEKSMGYILLSLAIIFVAAGIADGGYTDTMRKAVYICLECIGIG